MLIPAKFDYRRLRRRYHWLYGITIFLLLLVFIMPRRFGAHSWIPLGLLAYQPSEFANVALIIAAGACMVRVDESDFSCYGPKQMASIFGMFVLPFALTLQEPALGHAFVWFGIGTLVYAVWYLGEFFRGIGERIGHFVPLCYESGYA